MQIKTPAQAQHNFHDMICVMVEPLGVIREVMNLVKNAFDLSTAVGDQLDKIGSVMGLPRQGYPDARYRVFLEIQRDLLLSSRRGEANWTGTGNNLISIARTFVGPTVNPIILQNLPPYAYQMSVPTLTGNDGDILARFLCRASYGGVVGNLSFTTAVISVWGSETAGPPIANSGNWDSESAGPPITDPLVWGFTIQIGGDSEC